MNPPGLWPRKTKEKQQATSTFTRSATVVSFTSRAFFVIFYPQETRKNQKIEPFPRVSELVHCLG